MPTIAAPPEWVTEWLAKRDKKAAQQAAGDSAVADQGGDGGQAAPKPRRRVSPKAADNRREEMLAGIAQFGQWLDDLVDQGLANASNLHADMIERARRLVDAKAGGLAGQVQAVADQMRSESWTIAHTVAALGKCAVVADAFTRLDEIPEELRPDVAAMSGIPMAEADVLESGQHVTDEWRVVATGLGEAGSVVEHRTWLCGVESGRDALILQFAPRRTAPRHRLAMGVVYRGGIAFYPGADGVRAAPAAALEPSGHWMPGGAARMGQGDAFADPMAVPAENGVTSRFDGGTLDQMLEAWACVLSRQPLRPRMGYVLSDVTPIDARVGASAVVLRARDGRRVTATCAAPLVLLSMSGGRPLTVCGEWNGRHFEVGGAFGSGHFVNLSQATGAKDTPSHVAVCGDDAGESATIGMAIAGVAGRGAAAVDALAAADPVLASVRAQRPSLTPQRALLLAAAARDPGGFDGNIGSREEFSADTCPDDPRPLIPGAAMRIILDHNVHTLALEEYPELDGYQMPPEYVTRWFDGQYHKILAPCLWPRAGWLSKQLKRATARPRLRGMSSQEALAVIPGLSVVHMDEVVEAFHLDPALGRSVLHSCWDHLDTDAKWSGLELLAREPVEADRALFAAELERSMRKGQTFANRGKPPRESALPSRTGVLARDGLARLDRAASAEAIGALVRQHLSLAGTGESTGGSVFQRVASAVTGGKGQREKRDGFAESCGAIVSAWYPGKHRAFRLEYRAPSALADGVVLGDEAAEWPAAQLPGLWLHVAARRLPGKWWEKTYGLTAPELLMAMAGSSHREELLMAAMAGLGPGADVNWRGAVIGAAMQLPEKPSVDFGVRCHLAAWTGDDATQGDFLARVLDCNPPGHRMGGVISCFRRQMPVSAALRLTQWLLQQMEAKADLGVVHPHTWVSLLPPASLEVIDGMIRGSRIESIDWPRLLDGPEATHGEVKPHQNTVYLFARCAATRLAIARALGAAAPP